MTKYQPAFRWIALLLALMLLVPLISCGGEGESTPTTTTSLSPATTSVTTPTPTAGITALPSIISSLSGEVLVQKSGSTTWAAATAGMELKAGDRLRTGSDGAVTLLFFEDSTMDVSPDTEILINETSRAGTGSTTINLQQVVGSTVNRVQKLVDSESTYEVNTPAASAVVRGTSFTVIVGKDGNTTVWCWDGIVWVYSGGVWTQLNAGEHSGTGGEPTPTPVQTPAPTPTPATTPTVEPTPVVTPYYIPYYPQPTPEITPTPTPELTPTPTPEITPTPTPELTPTPTPEITPTPTPELTPTPIGNPQVDITSPADGNTTNRVITVAGTVVSDTENTTATITQNGVSRALPLTFVGTGSYHYSFSTQLELVPGSNTITVTATDSLERSGSDVITVYADIAASAIRAELTWNTGETSDNGNYINYTDLDGHLIAPCYQMEDSFGDCYFGNDNPDWDGSGTISAGDPSLDIDNQWGYGPEYIYLAAPSFNGIYQYKVHYFPTHDNGPSTATVRIWINEVLVFQASKQLSYDEVWDCACIDWPAGTVSAGPCAPCATPTPTPTPTPELTPTPTPELTPTPTPEPTSTPTPSGYSLTVVSLGCCPVLVSNLPGGSQTVPARGNITFTGIPAGTEVTVTAQPPGDCSLYYWIIDGVQKPANLSKFVTMNSDHTAIAVCGVPLYTLTVTASEGNCEITVSGLPGGDQIVDANNSPKQFTNILPNTEVTLSGQVSSWWLDGVYQQVSGPLVVIMDDDHAVIGYCYYGEIIY